MPPKILNMDEKQKVDYCIPLWLRDEQVKLALERNVGRIQPVLEKREDPIAVVCFGPSLKDSWEEVKEFPFVISCSGAHKFLLERGIVPNWHVEVDPRPHKVTLLGPPHPEVEYLVASTCNPKYFDHLDGFNVRLWHVFDSEEDAYRLLPAEEWALTGGSSVGLRAMTIARFLGFTRMHVFGMDGCEGAEVGKKHAAPHPVQDGSGHSIVEYEGKEYRTTPAMLLCAKQTFHELDQMADVEATFHGEGLVQEMAKRYERKPVDPKNVFLGLSKPSLISAEYADLNRRLHRENLAYGVGGAKHADLVRALMGTLKNPTVLDYGCGKGLLAKELRIPIWEYDPAVPGKEESPRPADLVVCTDVLEHIEPDRLDAVLDDLRRVVKQVGFFTIHTGPAMKTLPDGRNTHLIQQGWGWWKKRLEPHFEIGKVWKMGPELVVIVGRRPELHKKTVQKYKAVRGGVE